jgi:hypothetical protein
LKNERVDERLFLRFDAVFLRRYEVEQCLGTAIQFVQFTVTRLMAALPAVLIEYGEEEGTMMEGTVFDRIV